MTDYFTEEQIKKFSHYRHVAPKTTMETFYVDKLLVPFEKYLFPRRWSANTVTLVGQIPLFAYLVYLWATENVTFRDPLPNSQFVMIAIVVQWFSLCDCMDGMRARRTKCGSPLGRIIDEAIDQLAYTCIGAFIGYLLRVEPTALILSIGLVNVPFYCMEIRHFYFKDFHMIVGEIGPVEVELIYTLIFLFTGIWWGGDTFDRSLAEVTGLNYAILDRVKMKMFVAGLTVVLEIMFAWDNVKESFAKDAKQTTKLLVPVFTVLGISVFSAYLPSFIEETMFVYFLYQMTFAILILKLMAYNMSGKPYGVMHVQYIYLIIPIAAYLVFGVSSQMELMLTRSCAACAFFEFIFTIYRISKQYTTHHKINFFLLKEKQ